MPIPEPGPPGSRWFEALHGGGPPGRARGLRKAPWRLSRNQGISRLECLGYEHIAKIREDVIVRDGTCVSRGADATRGAATSTTAFPTTGPSRPGAPTSTDNLAALCRRHHRLKTHGRWRYEMTDPGAFTWTSPLGFTYLRDHTGSRATGRAWPEPVTAQPPDE